MLCSHATATQAASAARGAQARLAEATVEHVGAAAGAAADVEGAPKTAGAGVAAQAAADVGVGQAGPAEAAWAVVGAAVAAASVIHAGKAEERGPRQATSQLRALASPPAVLSLIVQSEGQA